MRLVDIPKMRIIYAGAAENTKQLLEERHPRCTFAGNFKSFPFPKNAVTLDTFVLNKSPHPLPQYQTEGAAGLDVCAWLTGAMTLAPMQRAAIPTGLYFALPTGTEIQVRPRSGLAFRYGITVLNSPGTIDADYRGELHVLLVNLSENPFIINDGDRIAQLVLARYERLEWKPTEVLPETSRSTGGFGSTGISNENSL